MRLTRIIDLRFLACDRNLYNLYSVRTQSNQERAMAMKRRPAVVLGGLLIAVSGAAAFAAVSLRTQEASAVSDPRQEAPIVRLARAERVTRSERGFTGIIGARVQSNLGFRVP